MSREFERERSRERKTRENVGLFILHLYLNWNISHFENRFEKKVGFSWLNKQIKIHFYSRFLQLFTILRETLAKNYRKYNPLTITCTVTACWGRDLWIKQGILDVVVRRETLLGNHHIEELFDLQNFGAFIGHANCDQVSLIVFFSSKCHNNSS